jgi:hypothetical protein
MKNGVYNIVSINKILTNKRQQERWVCVVVIIIVVGTKKKASFQAGTIPQKKAKQNVKDSI